MIPGFDRDLAVAQILRGQDPAHRHPAIPEAVAAVIVPRLLEQPALENLFACSWDHAAERLVSARWICRGSRDRVVFQHGDLEPGEVAIHNHPGPCWPESPVPSDDDLEAASRLLAKGIGSALITNDLSRFLLLQPPRLPRVAFQQHHWRLGGERFGLTLHYTTTQEITP